MEHKKADSPVGLHFQQRQVEGNSEDLSWEIIDRSNNQKQIVKTRGNTFQERETGFKHSR